MLRFGLIIVGLLAAAMPDYASACNRCGLFGRRCQFAQVQQVHHAHHVQQVAFVQPYVTAAASPEVLVVNNQYASPNGAAAFLAPQGQTVYGLQAAAQAYTLDPTAVLRQAAELTKGAQSLASQGLSGYNQTASVALQLNAGTNDTIARGIAASSILQSAGLTAPSGQSQTQALRIYSENGQWKVDQGEQVAAQIAAKIQRQTADSPAAASVGQSLVSQHCGKCHGLQLSEPKAGLFFDTGHQLNCKPSLAAVRAVMSGTMPKGQQLPVDVRESLVKELLSLTPEGAE